MNWNQQEHRLLSKSIAHTGPFRAERYCVSNERMGDCAGEKRLLQLVKAADLTPWLVAVAGVYDSANFKQYKHGNGGQ